MRTIAPPVGRGWEYLTGTGWDWDAELAEIPGAAGREDARRRASRPGAYDLVVDPSNLWLTIHESIGHATELDRALGYEAAYAGTSFATFDQLGTLRYGSDADERDRRPHRRARPGDRRLRRRGRGRRSPGTWSGTAPWSATSSTGAIAKLHAASSAPTAARTPTPPATCRCSGWRTSRCSRPPDGPSTEELIGGVERGIYVVGDRSWSIDMQRYNFQFTGQRFFRIENGRLAGQLRDVAYQATTTDFWGSMEAVGGPQTYVLGGAFNCGKAQPGQVAAGQPRLPVRAVPRRQHPQHHPGGGS